MACKRSIHLLVLVATLGSAVALGCTSPKTRVVGKWTGTDKWEFFSDDSCVVLTRGRTRPCTWAVLDDGRIKIVVDRTIIIGKPENGKLTMSMEGNPNYQAVLQKQP